MIKPKTKVLLYSRRQDAPSSERHMQYLLEGFKAGKVGSESTSSAVACVLWSKYPIAFEQVADQMPMPWYLLYTITGLGSIHEPNVPPVDDQIDLFIRLSQKYGSNRLVWRFDPVIIDDKLTIKERIAMFKYIRKRLDGFTDRCIFSFIDCKYLKGKPSQNNGYRYRAIKPRDIYDFLYEMIDAADGLPLYSCVSNVPAEFKGQINHNQCIDIDRINAICGTSIPYERDKGQRPDCQCHKSKDLGSYKNGCKFGCGYCYGCYFRDMDAHKKAARVGNLKKLES